MGTMELYSKHIKSEDYSILTRADTIGERPDFEKSPILKELDAMVGLACVKQAVRGLMHLQLENYDNELRGDKVRNNFYFLYVLFIFLLT